MYLLSLLINLICQAHQLIQLNDSFEFTSADLGFLKMFISFSAGRDLVSC